jgi:isopentenyldiphosphate isomerase
MTDSDGIYLDIDIVDENNEPTGKATDYFDLHNNNLLHRAAHVWLIEGENLIFQRRSKSVDSPGMLDATAGGHIDTGESGRCGAVREAFEEIGLVISENDLGEEFIFRFEEQFRDDWFENEFRHIYFIKRDKFDLTINSEVDEFVKIPLSHLKKFHKTCEGNSILTCNRTYFDFVFEIISKKFNIKFD